MKIDYIISDDDVAQYDSRSWQYKVYADMRSGCQDLCKFSLDFMPVPWYYSKSYGEAGQSDTAGHREPVALPTSQWEKRSASWPGLRRSGEFVYDK